MKKELLAPAGDFETLKQAVHAGADAIYLGGKRFGARKFASNFTDEELKEAIRYCHLYGVKVYVTVNTMIYEEELEEVLNYVEFLHCSSVDAIIIQDIGLIRIIRKYFPNLELHASTQLHSHNTKQLKLLEELGIKRVVVARELSLEEIKNLDTTMEIECFIHGALCVCYSGQCLFSSMLLNRSGNRGECAGVCRLPFTLLEDGKEVLTEGNYLLSPRELNSMNHIKELMESNVTSFKIEGRMKSPTTIGFIVSLYRKLIDAYLEKRECVITDLEQKNLLALFNRGFTDGYLFSSKVTDLMNIKSPNHIGYKIGKVTKVYSDKIEILLDDDLVQEDGIRFLESESGMIVNFLYDLQGKLIHSALKGQKILVDNKVSVHVGDTVMKTLDRTLLNKLEKYSEKKIPITLNVDAKYPDDFILTVSDSKNTVTKNQNIIQLATNTPTSKERVISQLSRTGNTPFEVVDVSIDMDDNLFIPIQLLNELRRQALDELITIRKSISTDVICNKQEINFKEYPKSNGILYTALVRNKEQLEACIESGISEFYTPNFSLYQEYKHDLKIYYRLDRVLSNHPDYQQERLLVGELGSVFSYSKDNEVVTDYFLNVANHSSVDFLYQNSVKRVTLSVECTLDQIKNIVDKYEELPVLEVVIYGRIEAMIMKYCPLFLLVNGGRKPCNCCRQGKKYSLKDRNGSIYPLLQDKELTHVFYHTPVEKDVTLYAQYGVSCFRFDFLDEDRNEVLRIIKNIKR